MPSQSKEKGADQANEQRVLHRVLAGAGYVRSGYPSADQQLLLPTLSIELLRGGADVLLKQY